MSHKDRLQEIHNKGMEDSAGRLKHAGIVHEVIKVIGKDLYYQPPSDPKEKAAYDAGWDAARK